MIRQELGVFGLAVRACHKLASPIVKWGGVTFYERRLDTDEGSRDGAAPGFYVRQVKPHEIDALLERGDPTQDAAGLAARFDRGDRAFAAIDAGGRICHARWVSTSRVHIPEIDCEIVLGPRQAYFYNGYTHRDARKRGVDGLVRRFIFDTLTGEGFVSAFSYVRLDNPAGCRAASRSQRAMGTIRYITPLNGSPVLIGAARSDLPTLERVGRLRTPDRDRVDAWRRWFTGWTAEPLSKRSTGCASLDERAFVSAAAFIRTSLALAPSDEVLDVGCDSAMITRHIAPHARRLLGIDFIHEMLRDTSRLPLMLADGRSPWFVTADACRLPIRSAAFTKTYCSAMLHTLPTREHGLRAIHELIRVTATGGTVLISSVPDRAKRLASRVDIWTRASTTARVTLPFRWLVPRRLKTLARRVLGRPTAGLPEFLDYDLKRIACALRARGLACEIRDFPVDYWSDEFRKSRSNLIIRIPPAAPR